MEPAGHEQPGAPGDGAPRSAPGSGAGHDHLERPRARPASSRWSSVRAQRLGVVAHRDHDQGASRVPDRRPMSVHGLAGLACRAVAGPRFDTRCDDRWRACRETRRSRAAGSRALVQLCAMVAQRRMCATLLGVLDRWRSPSCRRWRPGPTPRCSAGPARSGDRRRPVDQQRAAHPRGRCAAAWCWSSSGPTGESTART